MAMNLDQSSDTITPSSGTLTVSGRTSATNIPATGTVLASVTAPATNPVTGTPSASNFLRGDGTWAIPTAGTGTVTSVAASVPAFLSIAGSPITTSGTLAISYSGTALPVANGGTGLTSLTVGYIPYGNGTSAFNSSSGFSYDGSNFLIGTTVIDPSGDAFSFQTANKYGCFSHATGATSGTGYIYFRYAGTSIGSITQTGTTAVLYNTTSDYRLKNDITPIQNALAIVEALNPVNFTWVDGRKDDGFIAHEIQAIIPNCVTGKKDAVDKDGNPVYQQMDNSGVIPFLVKAIQELKQEIDLLKAK
jgi:hypothetical protein